MEFNEFRNPLEEDYDIKSSIEEDEYSYNNYTDDNYSEQLMDLIGLFEDVNEEELLEKYGISLQEYLYPNEQTIQKVSEKVGRHR